MGGEEDLISPLETADPGGNPCWLILFHFACEEPQGKSYDGYPCAEFRLPSRKGRCAVYTHAVASCCIENRQLDVRA